MQRNSRPENRLGSNRLATRVLGIYMCVLVGGRCGELYSAFHVKQIHTGALQTRLTLRNVWGRFCGKWVVYVQGFWQVSLVRCSHHNRLT